MPQAERLIPQTRRSPLELEAWCNALRDLGASAPSDQHCEQLFRLSDEIAMRLERAPCVSFDLALIKLRFYREAVETCEPECLKFMLDDALAYFESAH